MYYLLLSPIETGNEIYLEDHIPGNAVALARMDKVSENLLSYCGRDEPIAFMPYAGEEGDNWFINKEVESEIAWALK